jgi:membrane protease YdiL (CAAX protease family)
MWNLGRAYLQIGWGASDERPGFFSVLGIIIGSAVLLYASAFVCSLVFLGFSPVKIKSGADIGGQGLSSIALFFLFAALCILPVLLHLRRKLNCSFTDMFLGKNQFNLPWFLGTVAVTWATYVLVGMCFALVQTSSGHDHSWALPHIDQPILIPFLLVAILLQSTAEEMVFRGYFSKAVYLFSRSIVPVFVVIPVLFALGHPHFNPIMLLMYGEAGVFCSYVSLRTGGLQVPAAFHFANNSLAALSGAVIRPASQSSAQLLHSVLVQAVELVVIALIFEAALRWFGMKERRSDSSIPAPASDLRSR